jgi:hypothetical protein
LASTYKRVYHFHVRKTAGTSLNSAFWALGGLRFEEMDGRSGVELDDVVGNEMTFYRGNDPERLALGDYFFAATHLPAYSLQVPPSTFTITILRDPLARAVSYYRYLLWARAHPQASDIEPNIERVRREGTFLGGRIRHFGAQLTRHRSEHPVRALGLRHRKPQGVSTSFRNFLALVPQRHLLTQVYMFSPCMDPAEAAGRALACSAVCFTETFSGDLQKVSAILGLDLHEKRERRFGQREVLTDTELRLLRERLKPEYEMIDRVRDSLGDSVVGQRPTL